MVILDIELEEQIKVFKNFVDRNKNEKNKSRLLNHGRINY